jgi:hypothetical protein
MFCKLSLNGLTNDWKKCVFSLSEGFSGQKAIKKSVNYRIQEDCGTPKITEMNAARHQNRLKCTIL